MPLLIKDVEIVTGSILVNNEDILSLYTGDKTNAKEFLESIGRNIRFHSNGINENTLTMAVEATNKVLKKRNLTGNDIDFIAFCSQFPEYTMPSQALILHHNIKGNEKCITLDINANCLGMLRGLDVCNRYFNDKKGDIKRALLIGSDYASRCTYNDELVTLGSFSDGACALLLEYTDDESIGIIGSSDRSISSEAYGCIFPQCGMSNIDENNINYIKTMWTNPDTSLSVKAMKESLSDVLNKHSMSESDIDWYCGSQFAEPFFNEVGDACKIQKEKRVYVGDKYGYTGTSSPFFAFYEAVNDGRIKQGDVVFFTTVGVGISVCSMLVRI